MLIPPSPLLLPTRPGMEGSRLSFALHERTWTTGEMTQGRKKAPDEVCVWVWEAGSFVGLGWEAKVKRHEIPFPPSHPTFPASPHACTNQAAKDEGGDADRRFTSRKEKGSSFSFSLLLPPSRLCNCRGGEEGGTEEEEEETGKKTSFSSSRKGKKEGRK